MSLLVTATVLLVVLGAMFYRSFQPSQILFSNDGPLGANSAAYASLPEGFTGIWQDINWIGTFNGSAIPGPTSLLFWILKPLAFAKFYCPTSLLVLGLAAWLFFRQLGFSTLPCALGALAAALNTGFFSYACWGLGSLPMSIAFFFAAAAAVVCPHVRRAWIKTALAGAAIGISVMEGFDTGALLSLYLAVFILFDSLLREGTVLRRLRGGALRLILVTVMAVIVATQALTVLIGTQILGVAGMGQDETTKAQRWEEATRWSLPKVETLRVIIPGLFGYRMDAPRGGNYWGAVGQTPGVATSRHSGAGVYAGISVVILALWAILQSLRGDRSPYSRLERRMIQFWGGAALISLILSWGRHAPIYQFFYALPYVSTIRNPIKFMHLFGIATVILFGYGVDGYWRLYVRGRVAWPGSWRAALKASWTKGSFFERRWTLGMVAAVLVSLAGWAIYGIRRGDVEAYVRKAVSQANLAPAIVDFSLREVGWFVLFISATAALLLLIQSGAFAGARSRFGSVAMCLLVLADLGRASVPWVSYWNYREIYVADPVVDILRAKPYEHRVAILPFKGDAPVQFLQQYYTKQWLQHTFPYYNIQSLDRVQTPRERVDDKAYRTAFLARGAAGDLRLWELSNTRFVLGPSSGFIEALNQRLATGRQGFRLYAPFSFVRTNAIEWAVKADDTGAFGLIEFKGALPRAALYNNWSVMTNQQAILDRLVDPDFNPALQVLVTGPVSLGDPVPTTNSVPSRVEFLSYKPWEIRLKVSASSDSVLLLNDKYDPHWSVTVNGRSETLLRCNYLMRGVAVPAGQHEVVFRLVVSTIPLTVSLVGILAGLALVGIAWIDCRRRAADGAEKVG